MNDLYHCADCNKNYCYNHFNKYCLHHDCGLIQYCFNNQPHLIGNLCHVCYLDRKVDVLSDDMKKCVISTVEEQVDELNDNMCHVFKIY